MLEALAFPDDVELVRTTPEFTQDTVPAGLLRAHRVAAGVWGRLHVRHGSVTFVSEASGQSRVLHAGESQVIEPEAAHHVELGRAAAFVVEFYR